MEKIASPNQLVSELQTIIARVLEAKEPSRREIAAALRTLSNRVALIDAPVLREMDNLDNRLTSTIHNTVRRLIHIDDPEMRGQTADVLYDILESITRECEEAKENLRRQKMLI